LKHPYLSHCKWNTEVPIAGQGFVVAADVSQEWLLPWWFENYKKYNNLPVAFVDFGLSKEMKLWCGERGHYIHLPVADIFVSERDAFPPEKAAALEKEFGKRFWLCRNAWFKKPLACLQSPFQKSVWMDLDCEIKGRLDPLFSHPLPPLEVGLVREYKGSVEIGVNSGVILFEKGAPLIEDWAIESVENNGSYPGDQDALYTLILRKKVSFTTIPTVYNWSRLFQDNDKALVVHWHGNHGKVMINHLVQKALLGSLE